MGWITAQGVDGWYQGLARSPLNPPDWVFGAVWTALYFLLSVSFWLIWKSPADTRRRTALLMFAGHMILNWLWSPLFFIAHAVAASLLVILVMIFTAGLLLHYLWPINKGAALVFVPYTGWLIFAGHLTHYIWQSN